MRSSTPSSKAHASGLHSWGAKLSGLAETASQKNSKNMLLKSNHSDFQLHSPSMCTHNFSFKKKCKQPNFYRMLRMEIYDVIIQSPGVDGAAEKKMNTGNSMESMWFLVSGIIPPSHQPQTENQLSLQEPQELWPRPCLLPQTVSPWDGGGDKGERKELLSSS